MSKPQPPKSKLSPRDQISKLIAYVAGAYLLIALAIVIVRGEPPTANTPEPTKSVASELPVWRVAAGNIEPGIDLYIRDNPSDQPELWCTVQNPHINEDGIVKMQVLYPSGNVGFIDREKTLYSPRSKAGGLLVRRTQLDQLRAQR